jgi:hypothetical protein
MQMVLQHSPSRQHYSNNSPILKVNTEGSPVPNTMNTVTLDTIAEMITTTKAELKSSIDQIKSSVEESIQKMISRMDSVEATIRTHEARTDLLEHEIGLIRDDIDEVRTSAKSSVTSMEEIIREGQLRFTKQNNLVFMGVPENEEATSKVKAILQIILPDLQMDIEIHRLGNVDTCKLPRPIRIALSSVDEKRLALQNCRKLKGHQEFKGISVKPDLTLRQISMLNEKRTGFRHTAGSQPTQGSGTNPRNKRKSEPLFNFQSSSRRQRIGDGQLDSNSME